MTNKVNYQVAGLGALVCVLGVCLAIAVAVQKGIAAQGAEREAAQKAALLEGQSHKPTPEDFSRVNGAQMFFGLHMPRAEEELVAALRALGAATNEEEKKAARAKLRDLLAAIFADDMLAREKQVKEIEERTAKLRQQFQARLSVKDEIIDLQLKMLENESAGLGFPDASRGDSESDNTGRMDRFRKYDNKGLDATDTDAEAMVRSLGLQATGGRYSTGISPAKPIEISGFQGNEEISPGDRSLIRLPGPTTELEFRWGDIAEKIDDPDPFEYVLVQWDKDGKISFTFYRAQPQE
jgi:hypothetical protein